MSLAEGFFTKLEQVRQRPEAERQRWLWVGVIAGTLLIVGLWALNAKLLAWSEHPVAAQVTAGESSSWTQELSGAAVKIKLGWQTVTARVFSK
jgi:hypothetical protein